jgi:hypothetical protein
MQFIHLFLRCQETILNLYFLTTLEFLKAIITNLESVSNQSLLQLYLLRTLSQLHITAELITHEFSLKKVLTLVYDYVTDMNASRKKIPTQI